MNNVEHIQRILENAGFRVLDIDDSFFYLEDPSCVLRSFQTFLEYAWMVLALFTGSLIIGWGISMIRGAKNDIIKNFRNLILIFGILTAAGPILNVIYGGDLIGHGCKQVKVPLNEVNEVLAASVSSSGTGVELYEDIDIYDSGPVFVGTPDERAAVAAIEYLDSWEIPEDTTAN